MNIVIRSALLAALASALSPWNSTDQEKKLSDDKAELANINKQVDECQALADDAGNRLKGNQSIQNLLEQQVQAGKTSAASAAKTKSETDAAYGPAEKASRSAKAAMDGASKALSEANGVLKDAQGKMDAAGKKYADAQQVLEKAQAAQANAQHAVNAALAPGGAQLAQALVTLESAKKSTADAENAQKSAESEKDAALKALDEATSKQKSAADDLSSKTQAFKKADGNLAAAKQKSDDAQKQLDAAKAFSGRQDHALDVQSALVKSLQHEKAAKDKNLADAKKTQAHLPTTIKKDEDCIGQLKDNEGQLADETKNWKGTLAAYKALDPDVAPDSAKSGFKSSLWAIRDTIEATTYSLTAIQKKCAPISIPNRPMPEKCTTETGGSCVYFWCYRMRNAACVAGKCVCTELMCANEAGVCSARPDPLSGSFTPPLFTLAEESEQDGGRTTFAVAAMVAFSMVAMLSFAKLQRREIRAPEALLG